MAARNLDRSYIIKMIDTYRDLYQKDYSDIGGKIPAPMRWLPWESILFVRFFKCLLIVCVYNYKIKLECSFNNIYVCVYVWGGVKNVLQLASLILIKDSSINFKF